MKRFFAILVALVMAMSICSFAAAETEGADLTGKKVGFSSLMMSSEFFTDMSNQMQAYFEERGMQYSVADANGDPQTQIQTIENFVQMGMDYIICFVVDRVSDVYHSNYHASGMRPVCPCFQCFSGLRAET